mmetsp:Transcript_15572/g.39432  ORF Transcript_15572/g.39432 Transcript_15572/m.39432 type:complete len:210 (+) Transcript_15572:1335-1964(+)
MPSNSERCTSASPPTSAPLSGSRAPSSSNVRSSTALLSLSRLPLPTSCAPGAPRRTPGAARCERAFSKWRGASVIDSAISASISSSSTSTSSVASRTHASAASAHTSARSALEHPRVRAAISSSSSCEGAPGALSSRCTSALVRLSASGRAPGKPIVACTSPAHRRRGSGRLSTPPSDVRTTNMRDDAVVAFPLGFVSGSMRCPAASMR